ncbi:MAG: 3-dehydroquinate synthase, partial [Spirochaetes bacterium]|nr:3-dehydroquinate synthase [Spirochaetota bacterium]
MEKIVKIKLKKSVDHSYSILISAKMDLGREIRKLNLNNNFAVITDNIVYKLYKDKIIRGFSREKLQYRFFVFKNGERNKNLRVFKKISEQMLRSGFDRGSTVIALGGGVVGDLAGYIAGSYMRGIPFIQVPTTLLAQVDSSVGGKVAVDLKVGKNSVGLFYQPLKVLIDVDFLKTLPDIEFNNGMIEMIKHGIIRDKKYFTLIEANISGIKKRDRSTMIKLIHRSCLIKGEIVQKDEKEKDLRRILNFGHTVGHALEVIRHYRLKHGF